VAGQAAYSAHVEVVEARDIDLVLSRPLEVGVLAAMLPRLEAALRGEGLRVAGGRRQLGRTPDEEAGGEGDWQEDRKILRTACKLLGTG